MNRRPICKHHFADTLVNITTCTNRRDLGVGIGSNNFITEYVTKVGEWVKEVLTLSKIAESQPQPHATFPAVTHGLSSKWLHITRTLSGINHLLETPELAISLHLTQPSLEVYPHSLNACSLLSQPDWVAKVQPTPPATPKMNEMGHLTR